MNSTDIRGFGLTLSVSGLTVLLSVFPLWQRIESTGGSFAILVFVLIPSGLGFLIGLLQLIGMRLFAPLMVVYLTYYAFSERRLVFLVFAASYAYWIVSDSRRKRKQGMTVSRD